MLGILAVSISRSFHRGAAEIAEADAEKLKLGHDPLVGEFETNFCFDHTSESWFDNGVFGQTRTTDN